MDGKVASFLAKYQFILVVGAVLAGWLLWQIRDFVLFFFLSYILMAALLPLLTYLERFHIPKIVSILLLLLFVAGGVGYLILSVVPYIISQTKLLLLDAPTYISKMSSVLHLSVDAKTLQSFLSSRIDAIFSNAFALITDTFTIFFTVVTFLIITFYLLLDYEGIEKASLAFFPKTTRISVSKTLRDINTMLGRWVRGQLVLSLFVGLLSWLVYMLTRLPFAVPLAVFAGFMEIVPTIGPMIAFVPAVLLGLTISPLTGLFVAVGYVVVQMLEGNVLVPKIMQHSVGLHPLAVIVAVLLGARFFGILGTLLSVPLLAVLTVIYDRNFR